MTRLFVGWYTIIRNKADQFKFIKDINNVELIIKSKFIIVLWYTVI